MNAQIMTKASQNITPPKPGFEDSGFEDSGFEESGFEESGLEKISFEAAITELEAIVLQMEQGSLALDESLTAYKRGAALLQNAQNSLNIAQQQVQILTDANKLIAFNSSED